jgi:hypothetical protein
MHIDKVLVRSKQIHSNFFLENPDWSTDEDLCVLQSDAVLL